MREAIRRHQTLSDRWIEEEDSRSPDEGGNQTPSDRWIEDEDSRSPGTMRLRLEDQSDSEAEPRKATTTRCS